MFLWRAVDRMNWVGCWEFPNSLSSVVARRWRVQDESPSGPPWLQAVFGCLSGLSKIRPIRAEVSTDLYRRNGQADLVKTDGKTSRAGSIGLETRSIGAFTTTLVGI